MKKKKPEKKPAPKKPAKTNVEKEQLTDEELDHVSGGAQPPPGDVSFLKL